MSKTNPILEKRTRKKLSTLEFISKKYQILKEIYLDILFQ